MSDRWKERKSNPKDFHEARNGDHILTPFECDYCIFYKLKRRKPNRDNSQDKLLLVMIRCMNLDAFWSKSRKTVTDNTYRVIQTIGFSKSLGLEGPFEHEGPYPCHDHCGYEVAATMLLHSRRPGNRAKTHNQYSTISKGSTTYCAHVRTLPSSHKEQMAMMDNNGKYERIGKDKCASLWFSRFRSGLSSRMGSDRQQNQGMNIKLILAMIKGVELKIEESAAVEERNQWIVFITYAIITYVLSLRGNEGQLLNLEGLWEQKKHWQDNYFIITLLGKFKGEDNSSEHTIPCTNVTKSGINVKYCLERLMNIKKEEGHITGPAISDNQGYLLSTQNLDKLLHEMLMDLYEINPSLFPPSINSNEDIVAHYHCFRTFRRSSDTRALEEKVSETDINIVNRWDQRRGGKGANVKRRGPMNQYYAQFDLLLKPFLRYTYAM